MAIKRSIVSIIVLVLCYVRTVAKSGMEEPCLNQVCFNNSCQPMYENLVGGNLCMDLCVFKSIELDTCLPTIKHHKHLRNVYFINTNPNFTMICSVNAQNNVNKKPFQDIYKYPHEKTTYKDFKTKIATLIQDRLHYRPMADELAMKLIEFADYNSDRQINTAEAKNLWYLLNNKATFYMLVLQDRHYIPKIVEYCGNLLRTDELISTYLYSVEQDTILPSVFPESWKWVLPDWKYRCKIALSILEFVLDAVSFNPNDEFGPDSLYLCSPFETSFGYTFIYEAKLLNFESLLTGAEIEERLSARSCKYDSDCVYSSTCIAKCNLTTNKCSPQLAVPQIVHVCKLIKIYVLMNDTHLNEHDQKHFHDLLDRCLSLTEFLSPLKKLNKKSSFEDTTTIGDFSLAYALEYSLVSHELRSFMWKLIKDLP